MMKRSKMNNSNKVTNKSTNKVTNQNTNKVTNNLKNSSSSEKIGFESNKVSNSGSFEYDENSDHSFELRDCK